MSLIETLISIMLVIILIHFWFRSLVQYVYARLKYIIFNPAGNYDHLKQSFTTPENTRKD